MKISAKNASLITGCFVMALYVCVQAAQSRDVDNAIRDKDIKVLRFEELNYPSPGHYPPLESEGVVVVRVKLDKKGEVLEAVAIAGKKILIPDSLANARKWRFQPNSAEAAVIVYDFEIAKGDCKSPSSFFTFQDPNLATITGCWPKFSNSTNHVDVRGPDASVDDRDMEVLRFEDLKYPSLAREARISGVVVVEGKLDDNGEVVTASAISGNGILIPDCLANMKKWQFRPNAQHLAVLVYNFRFPCDGVRYDTDTQQQFVLEPPNFATIMATPMTIQTQR